jgi:hypothetical protein
MGRHLLRRKILSALPSPRNATTAINEKQTRMERIRRKGTCDADIAKVSSAGSRQAKNRHGFAAPAFRLTPASTIRFRMNYAYLKHPPSYSPRAGLHQSDGSVTGLKPGRKGFISGLAPAASSQTAAAGGGTPSP